VLGRHAADAIQTFSLGCTAERVARSSSRPVLVVGDRVVARPYRHLLAAIDPYARTDGLRVVEEAMRLIPETGARVTLFGSFVDLGLRRMARLVLGSVAEAILFSVTSDVLIVRGR
jgi:nucleotide-binding universal stress UspA family protein